MKFIVIEKANRMDFEDEVTRKLEEGYDLIVSNQQFADKKAGKPTINQYFAHMMKK